MVRSTTVLLAAFLSGCMVTAYGQAVTFNSPQPWLTQRNDSMTLRLQVDTGQAKKKNFMASIDLVDGLAKKKTVAKKTFTIADLSAEFALGTIGQNLVGGLSYLKIDWSIPGTTNKGSLAPVGIVALDRLPKAAVVSVVHVKDAADAAAVAASLKATDFRPVGAAQCALAWNKDALYAAFVKKASPGTVRLIFDGKNGKSAFVSFANRAVVYSSQKDSLWGLHYSQQLNGDTLKYVEKPWPNEIKKTVAGNTVVVRIPWYDIGIVPFEERMFGLGLVAFDEKGKQIAAAPASAQYFLPGTWADAKLSK